MNPNKLLLGTRETYEESLETWDNKALKALGTRIRDIFNTHCYEVSKLLMFFLQIWYRYSQTGEEEMRDKVCFIPQWKLLSDANLPRN